MASDSSRPEPTPCRGGTAQPSAASSRREAYRLLLSSGLLDRGDRLPGRGPLRARPYAALVGVPASSRASPVRPWFLTSSFTASLVWRPTSRTFSAMPLAGEARVLGLLLERVDGGAGDLLALVQGLAADLFDPVDQPVARLAEELVFLPGRREREARQDAERQGGDADGHGILFHHLPEAGLGLPRLVPGAGLRARRPSRAVQVLSSDAFSRVVWPRSEARCLHAAGHVRDLVPGAGGSVLDRVLGVDGGVLDRAGGRRDAPGDAGVLRGFPALQVIRVVALGVFAVPGAALIRGSSGPAGRRPATEDVRRGAAVALRALHQQPAEAEADHGRRQRVLPGDVPEFARTGTSCRRG